MTRTHIAVRVTCAALLTLGVELPAQTPRSLGKAEAEFESPFSRVSTIRELKDGRVLVVDERESTLSLIDFRSGAARQVGRTGAGPGEYGYPGRLVALPGDSTLLHDPRNARYHIIKPDGTIGETFRLADAATVGLGARGSIPRATDARGIIYFEGSPLTGVRGAPPTAPDSAPLMRYDRRTAMLDTVAWIQLAKGNVQVRPGPDGGGMSVSVGAQAYPARDDWAALPGGGVAVARVRDYHVDWYPSAGNPSAGTPVRYDPIAVNETEKKAWRAERRSRMMPRNSGAIPVEVREPEWPVAMPPFVFFQTFARSNGEVWVLRSHKASESAVYDVFTAPGKLTTRVALPAKTRLVGFGNGTVYLVRRDDDDLEYLQRFALR